MSAQRDPLSTQRADNVEPLLDLQISPGRCRWQQPLPASGFRQSCPAPVQFLLSKWPADYDSVKLIHRRNRP